MGFGSDFSGLDDLDANWTFLEGDDGEALAFKQAIARRFICPRGGNPWDTGYGLDLRAYVGSSEDPARAAIAIAAEARKDERVSDCAVEIEVDDETWTISIKVTATTGRTYPLTLSVDSVSVTLLEGNA